MFSSKNLDDSLEAHVHSPYIPPTLCISIMFVTSLNDVTIICFPFVAGKALHMHRRAAMVHLHTAGIPANCFLQLHTDLLVNSLSQILSLWHSPTGILVHPHTQVCNLLKTACKNYSVTKIIYEMKTVVEQNALNNNNKRWLQEPRIHLLLTTKW